MSPAIDPSREEILKLRARIVALERGLWAALELALRIRPEELERNLEIARSYLEQEYQAPDFAPDISDPLERVYVAEEVERLMRVLQGDFGFTGGIPYMPPAG